MSLQQEYIKSLKPSMGDDITEFVNELKLAVISPNALKDMKKNYKERYFGIIAVFLDRCTSLCERRLGLIESPCGTMFGAFTCNFQPAHS